LAISLQKELNSLWKGAGGSDALVCPHKGKSINLSAVNLLILLDFQATESTDQQINRFGLFMSLQELSIRRSSDLISTISENHSSISIFGFCAVFRERDGSERLGKYARYYYQVLGTVIKPTFM
jgi:hypothetical protein